MAYEWFRAFRYYRLSRAIGAALVMFAGIGMMLWARANPPESVETVEAEVTEVLESGLVSGDQRMVRVRLQDGREARMTVPGFAAAPGTQLPVRVEEHEGGPTYVTFDVEAFANRQFAGQ